MLFKEQLLAPRILKDIYIITTPPIGLRIARGPGFLSSSLVQHEGTGTIL